MSAQRRQAPCWLSVEEAGAYLHRRPDAVYEAIASGALPAYMPPDSMRGTIVHTDDLDAFVRETYDPAMCPNAARRALARAGRAER